MKTLRGLKIEKKIENFKDSLENYLRPLADEWIRMTPEIIQDKIMSPLFTVYSDKTIGLNFAKEVIILYFKINEYCMNIHLINLNFLKLDAAIKVTRYIFLGKHNYKNPMFVIELEDLPHEAFELYKRANKILGYKRDIEEIVQWSVLSNIFCIVGVV